MGFLVGIVVVIVCFSFIKSDRTGIRSATVLLLFGGGSIVMIAYGWRVLPIDKSESGSLGVMMLLFAIGYSLVEYWRAWAWDHNQYQTYGYLKERYDTSETDPRSKRFAPMLLAVGEGVAWIYLWLDPGVQPASISKLGLANGVVFQSLASMGVLWLLGTGRLGLSTRTVWIGLALDVLTGIGSLVVSGWIPWEMLVKIWTLAQQIFVRLDVGIQAILYLVLLSGGAICVITVLGVLGGAFKPREWPPE